MIRIEIRYADKSVEVETDDKMSHQERMNFVTTVLDVDQKPNLQNFSPERVSENITLYRAKHVEPDTEVYIKSEILNPKNYE